MSKLSELVKLKRNDVAGAIAYYKNQALAGKWSTDKSTLLFRLQDDPTELAKKIEAASKEPALAAALKKKG